MKFSKILIMFLAWYFLASGNSEGFGGSRVFTQVGPFASEQQCDFVREQIKYRSSYLSGCWSDGKN